MLSIVLKIDHLINWRVVYNKIITLRLSLLLELQSLCWTIHVWIAVK